MCFTSYAIVNAMNAAASTVPAKQLGLLVPYKPLAAWAFNTGERKTQRRKPLLSRLTRWRN